MTGKGYFGKTKYLNLSKRTQNRIKVGRAAFMYRLGREYTSSPRTYNMGTIGR